MSNDFNYNQVVRVGSKVIVYIPNPGYALSVTILRVCIYVQMRREDISFLKSGFVAQLAPGQNQVYLAERKNRAI